MHARRFPHVRLALSLAFGLTASSSACLVAPVVAHAQAAETEESTVSRLPRGSLSGEQVRAVIQANISQVEDCYRQALARSPTLEGRVTVAYTVAPDGHVSESTVAANSTGDEPLGRCIARAAGTWLYPRPEPAGMVAVSFPFNLHNSNDSTRRDDRLPGVARQFRGMPRLRSPLDSPSWIGASDAELVARIAVGTRRVQSLPRLVPSRATALLALADAYMARAIGLETALDALRRRVSSECAERTETNTCNELEARIQATIATLDSVYRPSNATMAVIVRDHPELPELDRVLFALGHGLQGVHEEARSTQIFLALVDRYPSSPYVVFALETIGRSAFDQERYEDAKDAFLRALGHPSTNAPIRAHLRTYLAGCEAARGYAEAALSHLRETESARTSTPNASSPYLAGGDAIVDDIRHRARDALQALSEPLPDSL